MIPAAAVSPLSMPTTSGEVVWMIGRSGPLATWNDFLNVPRYRGLPVSPWPNSFFR
jgi:hypothetical protein